MFYGVQCTYWYNWRIHCTLIPCICNYCFDVFFLIISLVYFFRCLWSYLIWNTNALMNVKSIKYAIQAPVHVYVASGTVIWGFPRNVVTNAQVHCYCSRKCIKIWTIYNSYITNWYYMVKKLNGVILLRYMFNGNTANIKFSWCAKCVSSGYNIM